MDINDLTIGEAKELANLFERTNNVGLANNVVGKYVIVRSRNEGINAGVVEALDDTGVIITEARRLWYHKPSNKKVSWYEGVALEGLDSSSKVSCEVSKKIIIEDYSLTVCSSVAEKSIREADSYEQN